MKSVKIYLDTQDFANLSKENLDPDLKHIKDYLIEGTRSGNITIGYSYPILFELIRNADELHKEDRLRKARFVKLVCGNNAHPYPTDLKLGRRFPNDGMWAPIEALKNITPEWLKSTFREGLRRKTESIEGLSRQQRRKLKSVRGSADVFSNLNVSPFSKADFSGIPVPEKMLKERMIERYIAGKLPAHFVIATLKKWTIDPENLFELWYEYSNLENPIENFISAQFENFSEKMDNLRENYRIIQTEMRDLKRNHRDLAKQIVKSSLPLDLLPKRPEPITDEYLFADFEEISANVFGPGRGEIFKLYILSMVKSSTEPKQSDLVDLLHLLYIKDVDLFRCDRGMAHHMRSQSFTFQHKIVPSLLELPQRVSELPSIRGDDL